jgi:hypothetical protein
MLYNTVGRSFFTPADKRPLPNGAEVWQGFYQSARPTVGMYLKSYHTKKKKKKKKDVLISCIC